MKIHIYTDIHVMFGQGALAWMDVLLAAGHDVEYIDLGAFGDGPLPDVGACDVNLLVVGIQACRRFIAHGLPAHGRKVLWMFDPLTRNDASSHRYKAEVFDALAPQLHALAGMDQAVVDYSREHVPNLHACLIPYMVAARHVRQPVPDADRLVDAVWLGGDQGRRREAAALFEAGGVNARFVWQHMWGRARDHLRQHSRIHLSIHADPHHTYFDQFRAFEAWAAGCAVVAEHSDDITALGIQPGLHLATAPLEQLPALCRNLLADEPRRRAMVEAGQDLLRREFSPERWRAEMLGLIERAAGW
ncbi:MAG: glycosyltransferase [Pseudomonadota bacterium]